MEARDSGSKIRPLPIDDIDGDAPQHRPIEPKRRLAPLIVIAMGAIAFAVVARGLGVGDTSNVGAATTAPPATLAEEPGPTTTTAPPPPPPRLLRQMLPVADDGLGLVIVAGTNARVGQWEPDAAAASYSANISQPRAAQYNADGTRIAVHTAVKDGSFVIDAAAGGNPVHIQKDIGSGVWHPTDPDLFAWTLPTQSDSQEATTVRVGDVSQTNSPGTSPLQEFSVPFGGHVLRAWGDWGFATTLGEATFGFDSDGVQVRTADGRLFGAATDGTLLMGESQDQGTVPFLLGPDGVRHELPGLDIGASDFRITADGEWVLALTIQEDGHTSILARTVHSRSTRLTSIDQAARIVGTAWDDRFLVLQETGSNDLVFKDWNTGAEYRISAVDTVAAIYLVRGS